MIPFVLALALVLSAAPVLPGVPQANPRVIFRTELGDITVEVAVDQAPATAANFLRYVDAGLYDGTTFHRTVTPSSPRNKPVPIEVIQGGQVAGDKSFPPIALERTSVTGLRHADGAVSMARSGPDTATSSFFICVGDQPELDFGGKRNADGQGFAVFGRVVAGMEVVRRIHQAPADERELLTPPVKILAASRFPRN
jgi:peptidyl-prolyl cis-trans isomerase A (cyclophilin A)